MAKCCFDVQKKTILGEDQRFFAVVLSQKNLGSGKCKFLFEMKYAVKPTDKLPCLREVYCKIYIAYSVKVLQT